MMKKILFAAFALMICIFLPACTDMPASSFKTEMQDFQIEVGEKKEINFSAKNMVVLCKIEDETIAQKGVFQGKEVVIGISAGKTNLMFENEDAEILKTIEITVIANQEEQGGQDQEHENPPAPETPGDKDEEDKNEENKDPENKDEENQGGEGNENQGSQGGEESQGGESEDPGDENNPGQDPDDPNGGETKPGEDENDPSKNDPSGTPDEGGTNPGDEESGDGGGQDNDGNPDDKDDAGSGDEQNPEKEPSVPEVDYFEKYVRIDANVEIVGDTIFLNKEEGSYISFYTQDLPDGASCDVLSIKMTKDGQETNLPFDQLVTLPMENDYFLEVSFEVSLGQEGSNEPIRFTKVFHVLQA